MKAVSLLIESQLPPDLRREDREYTAKGIGELLSDVAVKYPEEYNRISKLIADTGRHATYWQGETIGLSDLKPVIDKDVVFSAMTKEIKQLDKKDPKYAQKRELIWHKYNDELQKQTSAQGRASGNSIAAAVLSGARGKDSQLKMMLTTPGLYQDARGDTIPLFVRNSFSEGLSPAEFLASTYGARNTVTVSKTMTAKGGDYCLAHGTMVRMADGTEKAIESIVAGDRVQGADRWGQVFPVNVVRTFKQGKKNVLRYTTAFGKVVCTPNHKFLTKSIHGNNVTSPMGDIAAGLSGIYTHQAGGPTAFDLLTGVLPMGKVECYDIEVDHPDHLFVLANGFITSNSKQLIQANIVNKVTAKDCGTSNGIDLPVDDKSLRGRFLAKETAGVPAGTMIDRSVMSKLEKSGVKKVIARSALTCSQDTGVCAQCVGKLYNQKVPSVGDMVGVTASQSVAEPVVQGSLSCIAEGTLVRMADMTVKPIQDIKVGDWVLGADMEAHTFPVEVKHVWDQGEQPVEEYTYKMGSTKVLRSLVCTADHILLQNRKLYAAMYKKYPEDNFQHPDNYKAVKMKAGAPGKDMAAVLPVSCDLPGAPSEELALLLGCLLGDGIRQAKTDHTILFSCADPTLIEALNGVLNPLGYRCVKRKRSFDYALVGEDRKTWMDKDAQGRAIAGTSSHLLRAKNKEWGLFQKYAHEKTLPTEVITWDKPSVCKVIAGYTATDGCLYMVSKGSRAHVSFSSTSRKLLEGMQELLAVRLGIYTSDINIQARAGTNNYTHDCYTMVISRADQVRRFFEEVGPYIPGVKQQKLQELWPIVKAMPIHHSEPFYRSKRVSVEPKGVKHCWDISVDHTDELFVLANGLIVKNSKHTAGVASGKRQFAGFDVLNNLVQMPQDFPDKATVSEASGVVQNIQEAPQGGYTVTIDGVEHYTPPGYDLLVKQGDRVEPGDQLSDGIIDPSDIVRLRGIGSGRRYLSERLHQALADSGFGNDRRNVEIVARGLVNHAIIDDDEGMPGRLPGDMLEFNRLQAEYTPPADTRKVTPMEAVGQYLQKPVMHYSVGTKLTPKQAQRLSDSGYTEVYAANKEPQWHPDTQRLRTSQKNTTDWMGRMYGSYLKDTLQESATRGYDTNVKSNPHFAPRLAIGLDFGKNIERTGEF